MAMLVTLYWGLQSVGFTKGGVHKIMDVLSLQPHIYNIITKTTRWNVVKNSASSKKTFFLWGGGRFCVIFPVFRAFPVQARQIFWTPKKGEACA